MMWKSPGRRFDSAVGGATEHLARRITRRDALRTTVLSTAAVAGSVALGRRPAFASVTCPDPCGPSPFCTSLGLTCPNTGCPSGRTLCTKKTGFRCTCEWATGSWVHCQGYGNCGNGYTLCQDCIPSSSCSICICISGVICGQCCSPADVLNEHRKIEELAAASS